MSLPDNSPARSSSRSSPPLTTDGRLAQPPVALCRAIFPTIPGPSGGFPLASAIASRTISKALHDGFGGREMISKNGPTPLVPPEQQYVADSCFLTFDSARRAAYNYSYTFEI